MRRIALLAALAAALTVPGVASAHTDITYWDRSSDTVPTNNESNTVLAQPFDCGDVVAVDTDPNTATPRILYLDIPDDNRVIGYGASMHEFTTHWHFGAGFGAGGVYSPGDGTSKFLALGGYPEEQTLSVRYSLTIANSSNHLMKIRSDGNLWLFHRWC